MTAILTKILTDIKNPSDVKKLSVDEMKILAEDIREAILNRVNTLGGHLGPDLGIVEATIAMHYVFNSPSDKFIFDVSHQCYPHKMLTGRKQGFLDPLNNLEISGYSNPSESKHDHFVIGHTSTSVSLATGVAKARDLNDEKYNVIALIGDGSLSGGEAFEGLDNAATLGSNFIVIVNDNDMCIAENHGGLYQNLKLLRETKGQAECNFFKSLGFDYRYVDNGNNVKDVIEALKTVKDIGHPVVVHIHTIKGHGLKVAEENKEMFHWIMPGTLDRDMNSVISEGESYDSITKDFLMKKKTEGYPILSISPATP